MAVLEQVFAGDVPDGERWFRKSGVDCKVHSKTFAKDGKDALVSTFNIDGRSYSTNWGLTVSVANCPAFARQVEYDITRIFSRGKPPAVAPGFSLQLFVNKMLKKFH